MERTREEEREREIESKLERDARGGEMRSTVLSINSFVWPGGLTGRIGDLLGRN